MNKYSDDLESQVDALKIVLNFNKKIAIFGENPSSAEIKNIKEICKNYNFFKFDFTMTDLDFLHQLADFANKIGGSTY